MDAGQIEVSTGAGVMSVRVEGRATFVMGPSLQDYLQRGRVKGITVYQVDLQACDSVDSTFVGILTRLALRTRGKAEVRLMNAKPNVRQQINGLGLGTFFVWAEGRVTGENWRPLNAHVPPRSLDQQALADTLVDAHEALGEAHPDNVERFKDALHELRKDRPQRGRDET